jgi:DnaJ-class molecular chaperone
VSARRYPTEQVECPSCDGMGEDVYAPDDPLSWHGNRCVYCFGTGTVTVCANCYDDYDGCAACMPEYVGCSHCGGTGGVPVGPFGGGRAICTYCGGSGSLRKPPAAPAEKESK